MNRKRSVILLSGGLDSAANLALCRVTDEPVLALTADYGQRACVQEVRSARELCAHFEVPHQVLDIRWLGGLGGSALTSLGRAVPDPGAASLDDLGVTRATARSVWVPNRNGLLINAAAAFAESLGAEQVVLGFNREEAATFPDNTVEFMWQATQALKFSTANAVRVHSYTASLDKREIVEALDREAPGFPFDRVWSCYQGGDRPCGACESCRRLERALSHRRRSPPVENS